MLPEPALPPPRMETGARRVFFLAAGFAFLGLAALGAALPGLPTTPWVLLASYCFARSSPRLHRWLRRSPVFGHLIRDWEEHRGVRRRTKFLAAAMVIVAVSLSLTFGGMVDWVKFVIAGCAACGVGTILFVVPTVGKAKSCGETLVSSQTESTTE